MAISDYFQLTYKGILPSDELPPVTLLSKNFFGLSLGLEIIYLLVFISLFALSVYRSVKKIKNPKFKPVT